MDKKIDVTIKKVSSNEPNVSKRHTSYDVYHNGKYHTTFNDINDALDHKEKMQKEELEIDEAVLSIAQRQKRAMIMRRYQAKIERSREMAKKRIAPKENIKKRAYAQARQIVRRKVAGKRGAEYEKLGPSEKMAIDRAVEGKQKLIKKIALRLIPRVKAAEQQRLSTFMKGQAIKNHGQPEGKTKESSKQPVESSGSSSVKEEFNSLFSEQFPPMAERSERKQPEEKTNTFAKKSGGKELKGNKNIIQYSKFEEECECNSAVYKAIAKKARKSKISEDILGEVYNRGMEAWYEETGVTQQQYAFARVNSFINQGKSYFNEDADLHEESNSYIVKGKSPFYKKDHYLNTNDPRMHVIKTDVKHATRMSRDEALKHAKDWERNNNPNKYKAEVVKVNEDADLHELSTDTLKRYVNKAKDAEDKATFAYAYSMGHKAIRDKGDYKKKADRKSANRKQGILNATDRIMQREEFSNWTFKLKPGDKTKVLSGDHKGMRGTVVASHANGSVYTIKHNDGRVMKHHISTLEEPITEGRAPGTPSIKRYTRNDGTTALKSLNKWGKRKDWRDTEGGLAKAKEHAGVDKITEARLQKPEVGSHHKVDEDGAIGHHVVTGVHDGVVYTQNIKTKEKFDTPLRHWHSSSSPIKEEAEMSLYDKIQAKRAEMRKNPEPEKEPPYKRKPVLTTHDRDRRRLDREDDEAQAIIRKRLRKEETEELDELSLNTLDRYIDKASNDRTKQFGNERKYNNRLKGVSQALKKGNEKVAKEGPKKLKPIKTDYERQMDDSHRHIYGEEVQQTNENFIDGKGPGKPGDSARHGLKGKSAAELKKIRSSDTASPRKKQLAHWLLNMHHNESVDESLKDAEDNPCWDGYKPVGTKKKSGKTVPNCVPEETQTIVPQSPNKLSKRRMGIQSVERDSTPATPSNDADHPTSPVSSHNKQAQIKKKIIDEAGNSQNDPKKRLQGTDSLVKAYKKDTPGECSESLNESFNIAFASGVGVTLTAGDLGMRTMGGFALHPSVIEEMKRRELEEVEEEVRTADKAPVVIPAHKDANGNTIPAKTVMRKKEKTIIKTGNVHDGEAE